MKNDSEPQVGLIREQYPCDTRIRLQEMNDPYSPVPAGMEGTVEHVDDVCQIHMKWDNGRTLALVPGVDRFAVVPPPLQTRKLYMPLTARLYERDDYGNMQGDPTEVDGRELLCYEDNILALIRRRELLEEDERGLMFYYPAPPRWHDGGAVPGPPPAGDKDDIVVSVKKVPLFLFVLVIAMAEPLWYVVSLKEAKAMENREEIIGEAMDGMIYLALEELRTGDEKISAAAAARLELSDRVYDDPDLSGHGRGAIRRYVDLLDDLVDKQYRHLYRQGVKDCVLLLRRLGVLR